MYRSPKYWKEMKEIRKKFLREQADKQASERAIQETVPHNDIEEANRRAGGPTSNEPENNQASDEEASKQR
jgi:hypothetical protein